MQAMRVLTLRLHEEHTLFPGILSIQRIERRQITGWANGLGRAREQRSRKPRPDWMLLIKHRIFQEAIGVAVGWWGALAESWLSGRCATSIIQPTTTTTT